MITKEDTELAKELNKFLSSQIQDPNSSHFNQIMRYEELVNKMISNLEKAPLSYRPVDDEAKRLNYYTAECSRCGWWGGSNLLEGGGQIADTGDYGDCYCPVCWNADIGER